MVWEPTGKNKNSADYHDNMNSAHFEEYLHTLCNALKEKGMYAIAMYLRIVLSLLSQGVTKAIICLDNAKYYKCEALADGMEAPQGNDRKSFSALRKKELVDQLITRGCTIPKADLMNAKKKQGKTYLVLELAEMAKEAKYQVPLNAEVIVAK